MTTSPAASPLRTTMRLPSAAPVASGRKRARPSSITSAPCFPALSTSEAIGTTRPRSSPAAIATSASWSIANRGSGASNATFTSSSLVAASPWREIRATFPLTVSPVRRRIAAGMPTLTRPTTDSSIRAATHKVAGSTMRKIGVPATTVVPVSTMRSMMIPSIGAARRVCDSTAEAYAASCATVPVSASRAASSALAFSRFASAERSVAAEASITDCET